MALKVLVTYAAESNHVQTTFDYIDAFSRYMNAEVHYLHVTKSAIVAVDLHEYDVCIQSYSARMCYEGYVADDFMDALAAYDGLKVACLQDEYNRTDFLKHVLKKTGFTLILTCVPQNQLSYVYPSAEFRNVRFETVLTGYVPDYFSELAKGARPLPQRPIKIGYRGRDLGGLYGRLGFDKYEIGRRMREICEARDIGHDIAVDEASRIYGGDWFTFVGSCRAMLGAESGSNVFDFDGSIERSFSELTSTLGHRPSYEEFLPVVADREGQISMGQISPRVFECAALRTPMVLFEGRYSGAIEPELHYIPLAKDFSNVDEVLVRLDNLDELEKISERAFDDLIESGAFSYRSFVQKIETVIHEELTKRDPRQRKGNAVLAGLRLPEADRFAVSHPTSRPLSCEEFVTYDNRRMFLILRDELVRLNGLQAGTLTHMNKLLQQFTPKIPPWQFLSSHRILAVELDEFSGCIEAARSIFKASDGLIDEMRSGPAEFVPRNESAFARRVPELQALVTGLYQTFDALNIRVNKVVSIVNSMPELHE